MSRQPPALHLLRLGCLTLAVLGCACQGVITGGLSPAKTAAPDALVKTCTTRGAGLSAKMRLLWKSAYLAELTARFGPDAATAAGGDGLSPATTKTFAYQSAGSLLTDLTLDSLATSADAVALWALSTDANAAAVFGCNARTVTGTAAETCFASFLRSKGERILRRPISDDEVAEHLAFFKAEALQGESDGEAEGFRQGLASLLVHPDFLYLRDVPVGSTSALDPFSTASRLAFALTGEGPDDALFAAAKDGSLARSEVLTAQVARLLQTPQARAQARAFYRQWLGYSNLSLAYSDAFLSGLNVSSLPTEAIAELDTFLADLTRTPAGLLTSNDVAPLTPTLASIYGAAPGSTTLPSNRAGILTRVGLLASGNDNWHVVARGLPVLQSLLCTDIAPPNFSVADAMKQADSLKVSNLNRIESVTTPAGCQGCHGRINPLGGARSDFDAVGRAVTTEQHFAGGVFDFSVPVVASTDVSSVFAGQVSTVNGSVQLSQAIAASPQFQACFAQQYVRAVLGRKDDSDGCLAEDSAEQIADGGTVLQAMTAVMTSSEFTLWKD